MLKSSPYTSIANSHHPFALFRLPYIFSSSTQLHFNIRNDIYQCIIMKFQLNHEIANFINLHLYLYIIHILWYTIFVRINPMGCIIRRLYKMIKHLKIKSSDLPFERRVAVFRRFGVICRETDDDSCWELLLPAGCITVENDDDSFWVFDTRKDVLIGVVEEYSDQEGGTLRLIWAKAGLL